VSEAAERMAEVLRSLGFEGDPEMAGTAERFTEWLGSRRAGAAPEPSVCAMRGEAPVVIRGLPFYAPCAHHLLPFFGHVDVAYAPRGKLAGLGWFPSLVAHLSGPPQVQERLAEELAEAIATTLDPKAVVVRVVARHLCMEMRGARSPGTVEVWGERRGADVGGEVLSDLVARLR
jgi:GTP cyclohydrolase I